MYNILKHCSNFAQVLFSIENLASLCFNSYPPMSKYKEAAMALVTMFPNLRDQESHTDGYVSKSPSYNPSFNSLHAFLALEHHFLNVASSSLTQHSGVFVRLTNLILVVSSR